MIRKLKLKFMLLSMITLFLLLTVIIIGMNIINYTTVLEGADKTLSFLSQNKGAFPPDFEERPWDKLPPHMSPETPYESRFFSVLFNAQGEITDIDTVKISSVSVEDAAKYADKALKNSKESGFVGNYRYIVKEEPLGTRITFLDCGRVLDSFFSFLYISLFMAGIGLIVVFLILFILSGKIIRPIAESYEKQKQFITDAGHEIKTPLTIITANADILEMELREGNESLTDIKKQTERLRSLTDDLVTLARMEETEGTIQKIDFPLSEVVCDASHPFCALAQTEGKSLFCTVEPLLTLNGNEGAITKLITILLDNALKYSAAKSEIVLTLKKEGHLIVLTVGNITETEINPIQLQRIFDRFYRLDSSRSSETGGHGIGLSTAKAIVVAHGGKITASASRERLFSITASFPI